MIGNMVDTYWVRIYMAGPIDVAKQVIRERAMKKGMCVNIAPTTYIYSGGEEEGFVVELINYPKFPKERSTLHSLATILAEEIRAATNQLSYTYMTPDKTIWNTLKE